MKNSDLVPVYQLVEHLQMTMLAKAVGRRSFIINEVEKDLMVPADKDILYFLLSSLMKNAVDSTENGYIRVKSINDGTNSRICVQKSDMLFCRIASDNLTVIRSAVYLLGGMINMNEQKSGEISIVFPMITQNTA